MSVNIRQNDDGSMGLRGSAGPSHGAFIPVSHVWTASSADGVFFVADRPYSIKEITARVEVAGTDASDVTADIVKCASGTALASGTRVLGGSTAEVTDLPFASHSISAGGESLTFSTPETDFYLWFTVDGAGSDPSSADVGIQVDILSTDTDAEVATKVKNVLDRVADISASVSTTTVTITNAEAGSVTDAADVDTGVTPSVTTQGVDTTINLKGTAATNQELTLSPVDGNLDLDAGDCLAIDFTGTLTAAVGVVTATLALR